MKLWRKTLDRDGIKPEQYQVCVLKDRCKGCRLCIEFCPRHVLHESAEFNSKGYHLPSADGNNSCLNCGLCGLICPEFAIQVIPIKGRAAND